MTEPTPIDSAAHTETPERRARWFASPTAESAAVFLLGFMLMQCIYGDAPGVPGHDSFYHIKMAAMIPEQGLIDTLPHLRFTYFTDEGHDFVSHHYGFHAMLVPFIHLSNWLTGSFVPGAKWAMCATFGLTLTLFVGLLRTEGIRWRWLWLVAAFFLPLQFFSRHAFIRAISPSMVFMLLITLLMFRRRYALTALAVAGYVHLYLGGVLYAPLIVVLYVVSCVVGPPGHRDIPWRLILWTASAWMLAILVHPYAGGMWEFLKLQVFGSGLTPDISVGREWKPYSGVWWFTMSAGTVLSLWVAALCLRLRFGDRLDPKAMFFILAHFAFLTLTLKARRFIEYWPIFCLLSAAYLSAPLVARLAEWVDGLSLPSPGRSKAPWYRSRVAALVVICVGMLGLAAPGGAAQWRKMRTMAKCGYDLDAIERMMAFLREHSEPGSVVFTDDWDIFPVFFYYNTHNHYIVGLDPKFTQFREPELWARYVQVSRGKVPSNATYKLIDESGQTVERTVRATLQDIRDVFGAQFVITDRDHEKLARKLHKASDFAELIYPSASYAESKDEPFLIFRIRPQGEHEG